MANLLSQNIGTNYKSILNLDATTINTPLDTTLRAVTDGMGTSSPLQLSTTQVNIGGGTSLGRLVVRGDGVNPIARFENLGNTRGFRLDADCNIVPNSVGQALESITTGYTGGFNLGGGIATWTKTLSGGGYDGLSSTYSSGYGDGFQFRTITNTNTSGLRFGIDLLQTFAAAAGSANYRPFNINYTINNSGAQSGTATGIFLNATETALNGMTHNLMDLQRGGVSQFKVDRVGVVSIGNTVTAAVGIASTHKVTVVIGGVTYYLLASNV
jgi:hypothetical protein